MAWFGFSAAQTASVVRGGEAVAINLWIVDAVNPIRPSAPLKLGAFRSPLFSADGGSVYAIRGASIVRIDVASGSEGDVPWPFTGDPPAALVGRGRADSSTIGVLTVAGHVIALTPSTGAATPIASGLSSAEIAALTSHLGRCRDTIVYEGKQVGAGLGARSDLFVRLSTSAVGRRLTSNWPGSVHGQPSFSADCRKIVFVSDER